MKYIIYTEILSALYFFLPAYMANMAPPLFKKINPFPQAVDMGRSIRGERITGSHKTWGGIIIASLIGGITFRLQGALMDIHFFKEISLIDYSAFTISLGLLLGFGAIFGDLVKSFFKRRIGKKPGERWFPFDQTDFIIGAIVFSYPLYNIPLSIMIIGILLTPILHVTVNHIGFYLGINKSRW